MSFFDRPHLLPPQASLRKLQVDRPQPSPTYMNTLFTKLNQKAGAPWICDLLYSAGWDMGSRQACFGRKLDSYNTSMVVLNTFYHPSRSTVSWASERQGPRCTYDLHTGPQECGSGAPADGSWFADASRSLGAEVAPV